MGLGKAGSEGYLPLHDYQPQRLSACVWGDDSQRGWWSTKRP